MSQNKMRLRSCGYLSLIFTLHATVGFAQQEPEKDDTLHDDAAVHFEQGIALYKQQNYEAAAVEFLRAYELKPSFKILFNIGQTEYMQEHYAAAMVAYEQYLLQGADLIPEDRRMSVGREVDQLRLRVGYIKITGGRSGTTVLIDGEESGSLPLSSPVTVDIGKRDVEIFDGTASVFRRVYRVAAQQTVQINLDTSAVAPPAPERISTDTPQDKPVSSNQNAVSAENRTQSVSGKKITGAVLLALGLTAGGIGAVTGGISLSKKQNIDDNCKDAPCSSEKWQGTFDTVRHLSIATDVLLGCAAASTAAGIILLLLERKSEKPGPISAVLVPDQSGVMTGIRGRF